MHAACSQPAQGTEVNHARCYPTSSTKTGVHFSTRSAYAVLDRSCTRVAPITRFVRSQPEALAVFAAQRQEEQKAGPESRVVSEGKARSSKQQIVGLLNTADVWHTVVPSAAHGRRSHYVSVATPNCAGKASLRLRRNCVLLAACCHLYRCSSIDCRLLMD